MNYFIVFIQKYVIISHKCGEFMYTEIFIDFKGNKIRFKTKLNIELYERNADEFLKLDDKVFFETDDINFNKSILDQKVESLNNRIIERFNLKDNFIKNSNFQYFASDYFFKNNNLAYNFLKNRQDFNIKLITSNYNKLISELGNNDLKNLKIIFENSTDQINYIEFYNMYQKLNEIVNFVKYYKLTPLEQVLLVYDIVKANEYKKESENENYNDSRNLNRIITNDKIVCVGFTNLLNFILTNLGFETTKVEIEYTNKNVGHIRNEIYIKDDFYNIDGNFFLDATWDSKKTDDYIDKYYFFLKPLKFFKIIKKDEEITSPKIFKILQKNYDELLEYIKQADNTTLFEISFNLDALINRNSNIKCFNILCGKPKEEIENSVKDVYNKYNQFISKKVFKNALYKVRKIEYINKIINFIPDDEYLEYVCDKYYKETPETKLLKFLGIKYEIKKENLCTNSNNINEDILKLRLIKVLKNRSNDFSNNQYIKKM